MTDPTLASFLYSLDCCLSDLAPDVREPIEQAIGLLVRACEDAAHARDLWEQTALRQSREVASLQAQVDALQDVARQRQATVGRLERLVSKLLREVDRVERQAGRRLMRAMYGKNES